MAARTPTRFSTLDRRDSWRSGSASSGSRHRTPSPGGSRPQTASSGTMTNRSRARSASPQSRPSTAGADRPPWWDPWEAARVPSELQVGALREFWGRTGGRLGRWAAQEGWQPPPPTRDDKAAETDALIALCGANLEFKPRRGITWVDGAVAKLELVRHGLEASLARCASLAFLDTCVVLNLRGNSLGGNIPDALGHMMALEHLDLAENELEGTLPAELSNCTKLRVLRLEDNNLFGGLAPVVSLERLEELCAQRNRLSGKLPFNLGLLSQLRLCLLHDNTNLRGSVPPSLARCENLEALLLCGTRVDPGTVPPELIERGCDVQVAPPQGKEEESTALVLVED